MKTLPKMTQRASSLAFLLLSLFVFACGETSVSTVKTTSKTTSSTTSTKTSSLTKTETEKSTEMPNSEIWRNASREGWLNSNTAQALYSTTRSNISKSELESSARERLAWLLLLNDYRVTRNEKKAAEVLANSNLFAGLGEQEFYQRQESSRNRTLIVLKANGLKSKWEQSRSKLESRFPELKPLRKK